jgi:rhodanese-related sulfurtransferase
MKQFLLPLAGLVTVVLLLVPGGQDSPLPPPPGEQDLVSPETLVEWMIGGEQHYHLLDARPVEAFLQNGLRGAVSIPADSMDSFVLEGFPKGHLVVVYGETGEDGAEAFRQVRAVNDDVLLLDGGFAAWNEHILEPTEPGSDAPDADWNRYRERIAVANYFLGKADSAPRRRRRTVAPVVRPRSQVKNEGC